MCRVHILKENFSNKTVKVVGETLLSELKKQRFLGIFPKYKYIGCQEGF